LETNPLPKQPELNLGTLGHVDNGKSTLVQALAGVWTAKHSEELRRGITIRVGYADVGIYRCLKGKGYCTSEKCPECNSRTKFVRGISFVDCPGHHSLMVTMLSGAALMDGALLVLSADKKCPQPQDREHLAAAEIADIDKILIVQNKIDLITQEQAIDNFKEIQMFVKGTVAEKAPVIPVSAQHSINLELLIENVEKHIPTPKRDLSKPPKMLIVRSFDVNKPGTDAEKLVGGVIGGSILEGVFSVGDEIEISPGLRVETKGKIHYGPLFTKIESLTAGGKFVEKAQCGGLVGVGTHLDPSLTRADGLVGNVVGKPNHLPPVLNNLTFEPHLFKQVIGTEELLKVEKVKTNENLVVNIGTAVSSGVVKSARRDIVEMTLRRSVLAEKKTRVAISRRIGDSWRLIGYGIVK